MTLHLILIQRTIRWIVQARKIKDVQLANPLRASKYDNCNHKLLLLDYLAWAIMSDIFALFSLSNYPIHFEKECITSEPAIQPPLFLITCSGY